MTTAETVKAKWPDSEISKAFVVQQDGSRRWMYCVMSTLKFIASRGEHRVINVGAWRVSERAAWSDAAIRQGQPEGEEKA